MGRRSNFLRIDKDAYDTPPKAVLPLSSSRAVAKALLQPPCRLMDTAVSTLVTSLLAPQASSSAMHWTWSAVMFSPPT